MSEHDTGMWNGTTEIPMPCPACSTFTKVAVGPLLAERGFTCSTCNAPVALGDDALFQLQGMKDLMSATR